MKFEKSAPKLKVDDFEVGQIISSNSTILGVEEVETEFGTRHVLTLENTNDEKIGVYLNQKSIDNIVDSYGNESDHWPGRQVRIRCDRGHGKWKNKMIIIEPLKAEKV